MSGSSFEVALESLLVTAHSASVEESLALVKAALSRPDVFVFGELLDFPGVQQVRSGPREAPETPAPRCPA